MMNVLCCIGTQLIETESFRLSPLSLEFLTIPSARLIFKIKTEFKEILNINFEKNWVLKDFGIFSYLGKKPWTGVKKIVMSKYFLLKVIFTFNLII